MIKLDASNWTHQPSLVDAWSAVCFGAAGGVLLPQRPPLAPPAGGPQRGVPGDVPGQGPHGFRDRGRHRPVSQQVSHLSPDMALISCSALCTASCCTVVPEMAVSWSCAEHSRCVHTFLNTVSHCHHHIRPLGLHHRGIPYRRTAPPAISPSSDAALVQSAGLAITSRLGFQNPGQAGRTSTMRRTQRLRWRPSRRRQGMSMLARRKMP